MKHNRLETSSWWCISFTTTTNSFYILVWCWPSTFNLIFIINLFIHCWYIICRKRCRWWVLCFSTIFCFWLFSTMKYISITNQILHIWTIFHGILFFCTFFLENTCFRKWLFLLSLPSNIFLYYQSYIYSTSSHGIHFYSTFFWKHFFFVGNTVTTFIICYGITSAWSGYTSGSFYKHHFYRDSPGWKKAMLLTSSVIPVVCLGILFSLNGISIAYGTHSIPTTAALSLVLLWLFVAVPLTVGGAFSSSSSSSSSSLLLLFFTFV